jgi:hypothetical protein
MGISNRLLIVLVVAHEPLIRMDMAEIIEEAGFYGL